MKHTNTISTTGEIDGYNALQFTDKEGRHFYPVLTSKRLPQETVEQITQVIEQMYP